MLYGDVPVFVPLVPDEIVDKRKNTTSNMYLDGVYVHARKFKIYSVTIMNGELEQQSNHHYEL